MKAKQNKKVHAMDEEQVRFAGGPGQRKEGKEHMPAQAASIPLQGGDRSRGKRRRLQSTTMRLKRANKRRSVPERELGLNKKLQGPREAAPI